MLKHRMIWGPVMIVALVVIFAAADWLDHLDISGTWLGQTLQIPYLPSALVLYVAMLALIVLVAREIHAIFVAKGVEADRWLLALSGMVGCSLVYIIPHNTGSQTAIALVCTVMIGLFLLSLAWYSRGGKTHGVSVAAAVTMFALVYMGLLPGFFLAIGRWHSAWVVAGIILITKSCDIGAYFTGRMIGRHKLIPWLSPGKTWEGLLGGVILAGLIALGLAWLANAADMQLRFAPGRLHHIDSINLTFALLGGITLGLVGQLGDLIASLMKRDAGFKDSGRSIPGFGGLLDVLDSPVAVAPVAFWLLHLWGPAAA